MQNKDTDVRFRAISLCIRRDAKSPHNQRRADKGIVSPQFKTKAIVDII